MYSLGDFSRAIGEPAVRPALDEAFETQDQLAEELVGAIAPKLDRLEMERAKHEPDHALDARTCTLQGMTKLYRWTKDGVTDALGLFRRAIEMDAEFAPACGLAAYLCTNRRARRVDARGHGGLGDDASLPHSGQQFVFAHHAFVVADQISQQLKHLGFDTHCPRRAP